MFFGKRVRVEVADTDRYGRTVGIVTGPDGSVLNRELLIEGMAWLYPVYCKAPVCGEWKREEEAARLKKMACGLMQALFRPGNTGKPAGTEDR